MKKITSALTITATNPFVVFAKSPTDVICENVQQIDQSCASQTIQNTPILQQIISTMSYILGAIAVLMLIIASITMVTAGSNPETAKKARQAILYAIIGLAVAASAQLIVRFILFRV